MNCEMCGKESTLVVALIEGTEMKVCPGCAGFGKKLRAVEESPSRLEENKDRAKSAIPEKEVFEVIVEDYARQIKESRERRGLTQEKLAKMIKERESIIHKMEKGSFEPDIGLARKIGRFLNINLVEEHEEVHNRGGAPGERQRFTLGDFIKKKD